MRYFTLLLVLLPLAAGAQTYDYHDVCDGFCGPAAIAFATGEDRLHVGGVMDWQHWHRFSVCEDLQDSPAAHKMALLKMGYRYTPRTISEILAGKCAPNRCVLLIHGEGFVSSILGQHWVVVQSVTPDGIMHVHYGDGSIRDWSSQTAIGYYTRGLPACAYEVVGRAPGKATWLNTLWDKLMRRFF